MAEKKNKIKKIIMIAGSVAGGIFVASKVIGKMKKTNTVHKEDSEQENPFVGKKVIFVPDENDKMNADGVKGHLEAIGDTEYRPGFYEKYVKRAFDIILSLGGLIVLSPVYLIVSVAIVIEDPGPVFFTQKRIGQNKKYFKLHKFRSMKMSTPHDVPTHMLDNPEQYITRVGSFIRRHSIDELLQVYDILVSNMSVVGPRPGLWNQDVLTAERDKYGANDVKPGLTGWAQINGRDELEIPDKAKLDGEYVKKMGLLMDVKCFLGSVGVFHHDSSVVEGGTGEMTKVGCHYTDDKTEKDLIGNIGFGEPVVVNKDKSKKVLITGAGSYIGETFKNYAAEKYTSLLIDAIDMIDGTWREKDFSEYDIVYHVAGLAHADVGNVDDETKAKYYAINSDLAVDVCQKAKNEGVKEFIFMSSMIVYGDSAPYGKQKIVDENTVPKPANFYGDSKLQADVAVREMADDAFKVIVLRPPMIYGKDSKGNYPTLAKLAKKSPVFPDVDNQRSMLHIDNLCDFLCQIMSIDSFNRESVVLIPQNGEWTKTSEMVKKIADVSGKKIHLSGILKPAVFLGGKMPGKIGGLVNKAFGNSCYKLGISNYEGTDYQKVSLGESIKKTECKENAGESAGESALEGEKHILVVSQYFYPEPFRINDMCQEWVKRGYKVTVLTGIPNYPEGKFYDGYGYKEKRCETWDGMDIIRIPLIPRGNNAIGLMANYMSFAWSGFWWQLRTKLKADYVFTFEVSPMTQALIGCWYAKKHHIPNYLYVQDLWPENVETVTGVHSPLIIKPIEKMVDYIYKNCTEIFATSPSFVEAICKRKVSVPNGKVHYWPQYAEEFYQPLPKASVAEIPENDNFKIIFTGNIGYAQGLQILPETAKLLKDEKVEFVIVGDGRYLEEFKKEIADKEVQEKFVMVARQPAEKIPELIAACDAAFLSFMDTKLFEMTIPAKLQSYMACGIPIIAAASGEAKKIIEEAECGVCSRIGDAEKLSQVIKKMISKNLIIMGQKSRKYFEENFVKQKLMNQMETYLQEQGVVLK